MIEIRSTRIFKKWLDGLKDRRAANMILNRLQRVRNGNFGDVKSVGDGVSEMRIASGPGYRIYFLRDGTTLIVLLCGGDKDSQSRDIAEAKRMAKEWKE
jgi:putative addiction module killer protein